MSDTINLSVSPSSLGEGANATTVTVTAAVNHGAPTSAVTVTLAIDGTSTATKGTDYADPVTLNTITIAANSVSGSTTVSINPTQDHLDEGSDETIVFSATENNADITTVNSATLKITDDDTASRIIDLTVNDSSIGESESSPTTITVTATLRGNKTRPVDTTVTLNSALGGTASAGTGNDYTHTNLPASITIPADSLSASATTFSITPLHDRIDEGTGETILVRGSWTVGGTTLNANPATIRLTDDDDVSTTVTLSMDAASVDENGAGSVTRTVTATLNDAVRDADVVVALVLGGTAVGGGDDYAVSPSIPTVVISAGELSGTRSLTFTAVDDTVDENDETITVGGTTEASGLTVTAALNSITITDDDTVSNTINLSVSPASVKEKGARATAIVVTATLGSDVTRLVDTAVSLALGGTATAGDDYTVSPTTLPDVVIPAGQTQGTATIRITPRQDDDAVSEVITVSGSTAEPAVFPTVSSANVTIIDDDPPATSLTLNVSPTRLSEPSGTTAGSPVTVRVTAELDGATRLADTTVTLTLSGTATAGPGNDYTHDSLPTITIPAGETRATETFEITPLPDEIDEGTGETITVAGTANSGGNPISVTAADIELSDNDTASTIIDLTVNQPSIARPARPRR